jgi:hypothetical protein
MDLRRPHDESDRRKTMKVVLSVVTALAVLTLGLPPRSTAAAGKYDGSAPLICAATAVTQCEAEGRCQNGTAAGVNFPALFKVDASAMKLRNLQAEAEAGQQGKESSIRNVDHANGKMILSGAEGERGWSVLIHEGTGKMSAAVSGNGEGFVIFGQCALP